MNTILKVVFVILVAMLFTGCGLLAGLVVTRAGGLGFTSETPAAEVVVQRDGRYNPLKEEAVAEPVTETIKITTEAVAENTDAVVYDACSSEGLSPDITALKNNGQVVPNAYMFLDKNEDEIAAGDYWLIRVDSFVYGHWFYPVTGLTYQGRGNEDVIKVGAATFWCDNGGSTPHNGQYQMVDAKKLADMLLDENWELAGDGAIGAWVNIPSPENQPK